MKLKGAIFDMDGTLLDSMFMWDSIAEDYLKSRDIVPEEGLNKKFKTMTIEEAAEYYRLNYDITDSISEIVDGIYKMLYTSYQTKIGMKKGVAELLEVLRQNDVKMCVATATGRYMVEAALKRNGIDDYFCGILTCSEVGVGKREPLIFEQALELLGTDKEDTLIFEDALYAIETAKKAEFKVVGLYDKSAHSHQDKIKELVDYYYESLEDWSMDDD